MLPDQVQRLFRKARLIGRHFQIVHVMFFGKGHPEIIEVSTFRALLDNAGDHVAKSGRILRDNVWGSQGEDATRRDFTINAMYYAHQPRLYSTTTVVWSICKRKPDA